MARANERVVETVLRFDDVGIGRDSFLGHESGDHAVAAGVARCHRAGHAAVVGRKSAGRVSRDAQCHSGLGDVQPQQLGAGGRRADGTVPSLVVQAGLHELEVGVERELAFDLQSQDVSSEYVLARGAEMLAEAQHGGQNQDAGMADLHTTVVIVQGVGNGAIGQGSVCNRNFDTSAKHGCLGRPAELRYVTSNGLADRLDNAGQCGSQAIERRALGFLHRVARYVFVAGVYNEPGNFLSGAHSSPRRGRR